MSFLDLGFGPRLVTNVLAIFAVNCIQLTFCSRLSKKWLLEKLGENVDSLRKFIILNVKVVVSVILTCRSILLPSVLEDKLGIMVLIWILLCSKKQHVLTKVCETIDLASVDCIL